MTRLFLLPAVVFAAACNCGEKPALEATVTDIWGNPVEAAQVGWAEAEEDEIASTDAKGETELELGGAGEAVVEVRREGFIPHTETVTVEDPDKDVEHTFAVYPEPETDGYHLIGAEAYAPVPSEPVVRLGNELRSFHGIRSIGDVEIPKGSSVRAVFHTADLKMDEVARLDIELHRVEFNEATDVPTVDGIERIDVNLWTSAGKVDYTRATLGSDDNYLFDLGELPSGTYAFVSMNLLDTKDPEAFSKIAAPLRRVHPFTVK